MPFKGDEYNFPVLVYATIQSFEDRSLGDTQH